MVVLGVRLINENQLNVQFPYDVPCIELAPETLSESENLYLPWEILMALSRPEKNSRARTKVHNTVRVVIADGRVRANPIRGEVHSAEEDVAEVDVEVAADSNEKKGQSVQIRKLNPLKYSIDSDICNLEQVIQVPYLGKLQIWHNRKSFKVALRPWIWNQLRRSHRDSFRE